MELLVILVWIKLINDDWLMIGSGIILPYIYYVYYVYYIYYIYYIYIYIGDFRIIIHKLGNPFLRYKHCGGCDATLQRRLKSGEFTKKNLGVTVVDF